MDNAEELKREEAEEAETLTALDEAVAELERGEGRTVDELRSPSAGRRWRASCSSGCRRLEAEEEPHVCHRLKEVLRIRIAHLPE